MEDWKNIPGYEGCYQISSNGKIKSLQRIVFREGHGGFKTVNGKILPIYFDNNGYQIAFLSKGGIRKTVKVHRLIAILFIPNPDDKKQINHIDGNKSNNSLTNLEWCTQSENIRHADRTGLRKCASGKDNGHSIQVKDHVNGKVYETITEGARENGVSIRKFTRWLRGKKRNSRFSIIN